MHAWGCVDFIGIAWDLICSPSPLRKLACYSHSTDEEMKLRGVKWLGWPCCLIAKYVRIFVTPWTKKMATHSSTLAWKIPWMEEPGRLQSMGSKRVRHDWANSLSFFLCFLLEKEMATHSSVLTWRILWTEGPDGLQSMGLQRVRHNWATNFLTWLTFYLPHSPSQTLKRLPVA